MSARDGPAGAAAGPAPRARRGFALVAAAWLLVVLAGLALEFHPAVRGDVRVAANAGAAARARWLTRGALARTLDGLARFLAADSAGRVLAARGDTLLPPLDFELEGVRVRAVARDARARLSLDHAGAEELIVLALAAGVDPDAAREAARTILGARDRGAFHGVDELHRLPGLPAHVAARIEPYLTAAGDGRINANSAPAPVLATLPGFDPQAAAAVARARAAGPPLTHVYALLAALPRGARNRVQDRIAELAGRLAFAPREAEILVSGAVEGSPVRATLEARVVLTGGSTIDVLAVRER